MSTIFDHPLAVVVASFAVQWLAAYAGDALRKRAKRTDDAEHADFLVILPAALTLLGLIVGFTFSMAVSRYDQRKNCEEAEANAIGTEYLRANLLSAAEATQVRELMVKYIEQRILFYQARDQVRLKQIDEETADLQSALWSAVAKPATAEPTPVTALAVSGMNDVLNSQGYTQAAWWNRIPAGAWVLMVVVAMSCNLLLGYSERRAARVILLVLPLIVTIAIFLIADIDTPRGGVIRVAPQNLIALSQSLKAH